MNTKKRQGFFSRVFGTEAADDREPAQPEATREVTQEAARDATSPAEVTEPAPPTPTPTPLEDIPQAPEPATRDEETTAPDIEDAAALTNEAPVEASVEPVVPGETSPVTQSQTTEPQSWLARLQSGLSKTSNRISGGISGIFTKAKLDDDAIQDLEDILIQSDLGVQTSSRITDRISASRYDKDLTAADIRTILSEEVASVLEPVATPLTINPDTRPHVLLMVGVNGSGKTTTIGKLAAQYHAQGKKVMLVAADTFRAAAVDQLGIWASRTGADFISRDVGADSAGLAFDAIKTARKNDTDIVMIDTAGRLQNKATLMEELEKIIRVIKKIDDTAPHSIILVLDATTGQNALNQVDVFLKRAGVTGLIMTKLDGTARGGILVAIAEKYALPIHAIGIGEQIEDLQPFKPTEFADAIARN